MKRPRTFAVELALQARSELAFWKLQPAPMQTDTGYLAVSLAEVNDLSALLLCDPLTGLVAYPSFETHLITHLPELVGGGLHLAIGDVDDLRGYITTANRDDPTLFGHLAGNDCMRRVGEATRIWAAEMLTGWPFAVCATFGGDEVIVAAAGGPYVEFLDGITELIVRIRAAAPRTCSFASATTAPLDCLVGTAEKAYRLLVARVDERLFRHKGEVRTAGSLLDGVLVDCGTLNLSNVSPPRRRRSSPRQVRNALADCRDPANGL